MSPGASYSRASTVGRKTASRDRLLPGTVRSGTVRALRSCFNVLALNLALVLTSVFIVTLPLAINAAAVALERWRAGGEDRVVREFLSALRSAPPLRATLAVGGPLLAMAIATEEVHFFARGGAAMNWVCLGLGVAALAMATGATGYAIALGSRNFSAPVPELWSLCVRLALENLLVTGPLFAMELVAAVLLGLLDPTLALIGLPVAFLFLVMLTAERGMRRSGLQATSGKAP